MLVLYNTYIVSKNKLVRFLNNKNHFGKIKIDSAKMYKIKYFIYPTLFSHFEIYYLLKQ